MVSFQLVPLLSAALYLLSAHVVWSQQKEVVAYPAGGFHLQVEPGLLDGQTHFQVHQFVARDNGLYFLVSPGPIAARNHLIRASVVGAIEKVIDLGPDEVTNVSIGNDNTIFVSSFSAEDTGSVRHFSSTGKLLSAKKLSTISTNRVLVDSKPIITVSNTGQVVDDSGFQYGLLPPSGVGGARVFRAGPHRLAYIGVVSGQVDYLDLLTGARNSYIVKDAGFQAFCAKVADENNQHPGWAAATLLAAGSDDKGSLYLLRNGWNAYRDRAPLVVIHPNESEELILCRLQLLPGGNIFTPTFLGATASQIFFGDAQGFILMFYKPVE